MNRMTFNRVFTFWERVNLAPIRVRNNVGAVSEFKPTIDPLPAEIASWQKTFDEGTAFQVTESVWVSREQFELIVDEKI
jgi:hypothetical protein